MRPLKRYDAKTRAWITQAKERQRIRDWAKMYAEYLWTDEGRCELEGHEWMYRGPMARQCRNCGRLET